MSERIPRIMQLLPEWAEPWLEVIELGLQIALIALGAWVLNLLPWLSGPPKLPPAICWVAMCFQKQQIQTVF